MKTYADRLNFALKNAGINQSELGKLVGLKPQAIQYLCSGKGKSSTKSIEMAMALNVDPVWLAEGKGSYNNFNNNINYFPIISWDNVINYKTVVPKLYTKDIDKCLCSQNDYSKSSFGLKIENDVMQGNEPPFFSFGSFVIVDPEASIENNKFVIVKLSKNEIVLRQLVIDGNNKYLKKLNSKYPDGIIAFKNSFFIFGVVKEIVQKL
tara:strand:+ start:326 stop:949 length:624 start_codon:yes stop_codon:yes gene_type:complete